jgi:tungstate transport system permease protein
MSDLGHSFTLALGLIFSGNAELVRIVLLSLEVSLSATALAFALAAPFGVVLAAWSFPGRNAVLVVINALLGLPPVVVGLIVYLLLSRSGPLGGLGLLFTPTAMVVAQTILTAPIVAALTHRATEHLWADYGDALQLDGASRGRAVWTLLLMARAGLVTVFLAAFGRAIAEVGAIIMVGGNIRDHTRTMTTAIVLLTSEGNLPLALGLGIILITLTLAFSALAFAIGRKPRGGPWGAMARISAGTGSR